MFVHLCTKSKVTSLTLTGFRRVVLLTTPPTTTTKRTPKKPTPIRVRMLESYLHSAFSKTIFTSFTNICFTFDLQIIIVQHFNMLSGFKRFCVIGKRRKHRIIFSRRFDPDKIYLTPTCSARFN